LRTLTASSRTVFSVILLTPFLLIACAARGSADRCAARCLAAHHGRIRAGDPGHHAAAEDRRPRRHGRYPLLAPL
jgi:hypothetical protein